MSKPKSISFHQRVRYAFKDNRVAYISIEGVLTEGKLVSSEHSTLDLLKEVEKSDIKALVVRINSPGGTVGASQEIYDTLRRLSEENGIKVVASMGDVAASGGVYVAMAADYIFAHPGTVTGSIGVIIKTGNVRKLMDKAGIGTQVVKSGKYKDILSFDRDMTEEERLLLQTTTDDTYDQFVEMIAQRRNQSVEAVKAIADGRIFSGRQALAYGLVDALGGRYEAIEKARLLAGLPMEIPPKLITFRKKKAYLQKLLQSAMWNSINHPVQQLASEWRLYGVPLWLMPTHPLLLPEDA